VVEMKNADRRARRVQSQASVEAKRGLLRCPVCFLVQGIPLRGFACSMAHCPRIFANIQPPAGSQPVSPCETAKIVTLSERRDTPMRKTIVQRGRRDAEKYRLKEAQQLMDNFEKAKGRAATSIEELTEWAAEGTEP
jgi:hypothetical protein